MDPAEINGMPFYEACQGRVMRDMQRAFEAAQQTAFQREKDVTVTLKLTCYAPNRDNPDFGAISCSVKTSPLEEKSAKYPTVLEGGMIQSDGGQLTKQGHHQMDAFQSVSK